jgi:hypothetical protein
MKFFFKKVEMIFLRFRERHFRTFKPDFDAILPCFDKNDQDINVA